jgi:hypothetical protein
VKIINILFSTILLSISSIVVAGTYECNFNQNYTEFTCSTTNTNNPEPTAPIPEVTPPEPPAPVPVDVSGFITPNIFVANPSSEYMDISYIPGCLNGLFAKDSSTGCAAKSTDSSGRFSFGTGKQLYIKYHTPSNITNGKSIKVVGWNGSNVEVYMKAWITKNPYSSYEDASQYCRAISNQAPVILTGKDTMVQTVKNIWGNVSTVTNWYCKLEPDTTYYLGIDFSPTELSKNTILRFQVDQYNSDLK